jgi:hypothetical protein
MIANADSSLSINAQTRIVLEDTPWELHKVGDKTVWVKREDLCCPEGPQFSKIRGLAKYLNNYPADSIIGVLDTYHSKAGWGAAYVCKALGHQCYNFYPFYRHDIEMREGQIRACMLGAKLIPLKAGRSAILFHQAKRQLLELTGGRGHMLPNGLQLAESAEATKKEVEQYTPDSLFGGTWIVSVSTGTIAKGVAAGLSGRAQLVAHMGYSHSQKLLRKRLGEGTIIIDEGYSYRDRAECTSPFPCNPYYDLKAWNWLCAHIHDLTPPVVFWNIGS